MYVYFYMYFYIILISNYLLQAHKNISNQLKQVTVVIKDFNKCYMSYKQINITLEPTMICAGKSTSDTVADACMGDSGGALVCGGYAVGIISYGSDKCDKFEYPTINTNISSFKEWILQNSLPDYDIYKMLFILFVIVAFPVCFFFIYSLCKMQLVRNYLYINTA